MQWRVQVRCDPQTPLTTLNPKPYTLNPTPQNLEANAGTQWRVQVPLAPSNPEPGNPEPLRCHQHARHSHCDDLASVPVNPKP
ncbi:hypothetical protein T484DRAFT_1956038 [Baffinella frigidus]|nr:hypothetical protein T484DRAFT_1956038 [Cryptophyta sp. CCMP2293]